MALHQLGQRVSARCTLLPLSREGVRCDMSHRLSVAGGTDPDERVADTNAQLALQ